MHADENGDSPTARQVTYDLVDARDLGLENCDGVSDRRLGRALVVGDGRRAEGARLQSGERLVLAHPRDNLRKHPLIIIIFITNCINVAY